MAEYVCFNCNKTFVPKTKPSNADRPFCCRSCSAQTLNRLSPKRKRIYNICKYCGKTIQKRSNQFCDLNCHTAQKAVDNVKKWLDTGQASTSLSSKNHYVRNYIMILQDFKCAICKHEPFWNNKPLIFILDHIDGNSEDSSINNLRLVCPNCDTQLDTYKSKNKGNGRFYRRQRYSESKSF